MGIPTDLRKAIDEYPRPTLRLDLKYKVVPSLLIWPRGRGFCGEFIVCETGPSNMRASTKRELVNCLWWYICTIISIELCEKKINPDETRTRNIDLRRVAAYPLAYRAAAAILPITAMGEFPSYYVRIAQTVLVVNAFFFSVLACQRKALHTLFFLFFFVFFHFFSVFLPLFGSSHGCLTGNHARTLQ